MSATLYQFNGTDTMYVTPLGTAMIVQERYLDILAQTEHEALIGSEVAQELKNSRDRWMAMLPIWEGASHVGLSLRQMAYKEDYGADTVYLMVNRKHIRWAMAMGKKWNADECDVVDKTNLYRNEACGPETVLVRYWWD